ncbi:heme biosynthesis protein HemY [Roseibium aggregatum]|uniref:Heme biosynthesis protein HemY n=1 Tax=Roseibium aggregatum TaxID=187304 RepID=A0A939J6Q7_9HYPH|nr:heme biosynthesis HemY N-terminal domain-containing protein [Roseibium aggregatum]MBN9673992.1 heme biosynthesis protein HemY [Roseibium aggregatum]
MIRVFLFFLVVFGLAAGFAWMADLPGTVSISWNSETPGQSPIIWEQTPVTAAVVIGALLAVFLGIVWAVRVVLKSPQIASRFFRRRRKDRGYAALSHGLIALGTGNAKLARRHALEADKLLTEEPAAKLLLAQTAQLAGKDEEARQRFEAMLEEPETRALGLHGLFVEAERHREPVAARHYAEEAVKTSPGLEWAGKAVLGYQAVAHHWEEALKTLERNYAAKLLDKKAYRRQRAVILTALAQNLESGEPDRAYSLAKEAHGLALDLVPAAVLASRLATRRGDVRKASKVVEATWRLFPHPELAETYAHVRTGDSAVDRLKRVKSLSAQRANTPEGALAIARAALEAREYTEARAQLKKVLQSQPTRQAFLVMAELEEAEHGDRGRARDWLARALKAPQDKAWIADGIVSAEWQPVSPVTGKLDAFRWETPETLSEGEGDVLEDSLFEARALPVVPAVEENAPAKSAGQSGPVKAEEAETVELKAEEPNAPVVETAPGVRKSAGKAEAAVPVDTSKKGYEGTTDDVKFSPALKDLPEAPTAETALEPAAVKEPVQPEKAAEPDKISEPEKTGQAKAGETDTASSSEPGDKADGDSPPVAPAKAPLTAAPGNGSEVAEEARHAQEASKDDLNRPIEFPLSRMPDDPGPEEEDEDKTAKSPRPRFFN